MSYRIVIADKDPESREAVTRFLGQPDSQCVSVSTSGELKDAIKSQKPDLIILNAILSDAPGWRIVERIKQSQNYADVPVILMTGDPETPPLSEVRKAGADDYLAKPIDGTALRSAVNSLLGAPGAEGYEEDEDILIEFSDDSKETAGGEVLSVASDSLEREPSTALGDTVEIDTGTLVGELGEDEEPYGDTVRLNLDDMGLEDQTEDSLSMEPTIELVTDITPTLEDLTGSVEMESEEEYEAGEAGSESLPDFSSITMDVAPKATLNKDSVTVDFDAEDLGLELLSDVSEADLDEHKAEAIDPDDTEIERILEVRDPSKVITSEDLMVDDDSLIRDSLADAPTGDVEIIDLEEDNEIAEIDMEKLEEIDVSPEKLEGPDLDETTVSVESTEMEQWAKDDLDEIETEEFKDVSMTVESPPSDEPEYETIEGLSLEDAIEEEMTTEEFFGEELPTQEFQTERFPDQETTELTLEQEISLEESELEEISLEGEGFTEEISQDQLTLDTAGEDEQLTDETVEEEAVIEITDDIVLEEMSLQETEEVPSEDFDETEVEIPEEEIELTSESSLDLTEEAPAAEAPVVETPAVEAPAVEAPPAETPEPPLAAAMPSHEVIQEAVPSREELGVLFSSAVGSQLKESFPEKIDFAESLEAALKEYMPAKEDFSDMLGKSVESMLPTKEETLEALTGRIADSLPDREAILARVDELVKDALADRDEILTRMEGLLKEGLPNQEAFLSRMGDFARESLPDRDTILSRMEDLLREGIPKEEALLSRLGDLTREGLPERDAILSKMEDLLREGIPNEETFLSRMGELTRESLPDREALFSRMGELLKEGLPNEEAFLSRMGDLTRESLPDREALFSRMEGLLKEGLPNEETLLSRVERLLEDGLPAQGAISQRLEQAVSGLLPSADSILGRLEQFNEAMPSRDEFLSRLDQSMERMPASEEVLASVEQRLEGIIPTSDEVRSLLTTALERRIDAIFAESDIRGSITDILPDHEELVSGLKESLPEKERFQEILAQSIGRAVENSLPERVWLESVSRGLFDERTRGLLPDREEVISMLREEIQAKLLDAVEKIVKDQIERISSELNT